MNTGGYHGFEIAEGSKDLVECLYCTGILKDAMELPCGHLVCETCLQSAIDKDRKVRFGRFFNKKLFLRLYK